VVDIVEHDGGGPLPLGVQGKELGDQCRRHGHGVQLGCCSGVTEVLQWCRSGVAVSLWCYSSIPVVL
jgi:hypothetical protein